jgi:hypothetical protein
MATISVPSSYDVHNTIEAVRFGFTAITSVIAFKNKNAAEGSNRLMSAISLAVPAIDDIGEVPEEMKDLQENEVDQIVDVVREYVPQLTDKEKAIRLAQVALVVTSSIAKGLIAFKEINASEEPQA